MQEIPFELAALQNAVNYQSWAFDTIAPYVGSRVLEIGAGIGNMSRWLPVRERLVLTETDPFLLKFLREKKPGSVENPAISIQSLDVLNDDIDGLKSENFDTIVSFNVFEHIEDDALALARLSELVRGSDQTKTRRLITFVPAHEWAFGSLDSHFGHFRRYDKTSWSKLCQVAAPDATLHMQYFNIVGLVGWWVSGRLLKKKNIGLNTLPLCQE